MYRVEKIEILLRYATIIIDYTTNATPILIYEQTSVVVTRIPQAAGNSKYIKSNTKYKNKNKKMLIYVIDNGGNAYHSILFIVN